MHTGQLFPAVCFWKNLIPDAVKYWFSLTSVKALIFLLRLNNLSNNIFFFLPFWASINDDTHTFLSHCRVFVHAFLLSPTYGCCCCYSKSLEFLVSLWLREAQRWWSWKLTRQLFLWFRSLFENEGLPEPVGRIAKTSWPRRTRFKQIFCSSRKDSTYRKCSIALFIVASESEWSDNQMFVSLPPYPIPHQCHQCSSVNRITLRMFIRVLSLSPPPPGLVPPHFPSVQ